MKNSQEKNCNAGEPYYLGLDIGTNSVGFAVTDLEYNFIKKKGRQLFGFRLFDAAKTAVERRVFRASRRRIKRRNERIRLLQDFFSNEISKIDMGFYKRLQDSFYYIEDKEEKQKNTLFNDSSYTDKEYHDTYPTIYHLREALITNKNSKFDIRLIYLAIAHILKKRGHFLFEGQDIDSENSFTSIFLQFAETVYEYITKETLQGEDSKIDWTSDIDSLALQNILNERITKKDKQKKLEDFFALKNQDKQEKCLIKLILGGKVKFYDIFLTEELEEDKTEIKFSDGNYDEKRDEYATLLGDNIACIDSAKAIYDYILLGHILGNNIYISTAKVEHYKKHEYDLKKLKSFLKENASLETFNAVFRDNGDKCDNAKHNYVAYIGKSTVSKNTSTCTQEVFYKFLRSIFSKMPASPIRSEIEADMDENIFLPKQNINSNGVIPYQLHLKELEQILENASLHYPFLKEIDSDTNLSVKDKILQLTFFRIPYYIGPLNHAHAKKGERSNAWIVRKETGKIYPWNFEEKVDIDESAEQFIIQMTNKCTYLVGEDVLPKNSIIYSRFMVLNELNNLRINDEKIGVELKQKIYNELFLKENSVTQAKLKKYLSAIGIFEKDSTIAGIDDDFKSSMKPLIQLKNILQDKYDDAIAESIIETLTLFGEEKKLTKKRLKETHTKLAEEEINKIANLRFKGWGALSKKLFTEILGNDLETGEVMPILERLWHTNENFMHLQSERYTYKNEIEKHNDLLQKDYSCTPENFKKLVQELYCSPAVKRSIMQSLRIVHEIKEIMGCAPEKIFMEMAREEGEKKRTVSRKKKLLALYKKCQKEVKDASINDIVTSLDAKTDAELRSKKLYLYYTQMGKCMYSGEEIAFSELFNNNLYDIDHIYPRSLTKDDSLENLVLTLKKYNAKKSDTYPIFKEWKKPDLLAHWTRLEKIGFITKEKYKRLIKSEGLSDNELAGFINRQLVETRQSTKATANLLKKLFPDTSLVYSKAGNVSDFRKKFEFIKVRELNDNHHAEDAYFNIIVGHVYETKFTNNPLKFLKTEATKRSYSLARMYDFDVTRGKVAWLAEAFRKEENNGETIYIPIEREDKQIPTIHKIRQNLQKARPLFTRHCTEETGEFYDQKPLKKGQGQIPLKTKDERLTIEKYGAYNKDSGAYFILVKHAKGKKEIRSIEYVPVRLALQIEQGQLSLETYCTQELNLENPMILREKIKKYTLFKFNGFPMHITGRQNEHLLCAPAIQLQLEGEWVGYFKKIQKFYNRNKQSAKKDLELTDFDGITKDLNTVLFRLLRDKLQNTIYNKRPNSQINIFLDKEKIFEEISVESQSIALYNILTLFQCGVGTTDLTLIQGVKNAGRILKSKLLKYDENPKIIHQSITGLYTCEIDLFSL